MRCFSHSGLEHLVGLGSCGDGLCHFAREAVIDRCCDRLQFNAPDIAAEAAHKGASTGHPRCLMLRVAVAGAAHSVFFAAILEELGQAQFRQSSCWC